MCGLVGIAGDTSGTWKDVFARLLLFDSVRGLHSTGAGFVGRYNDSITVAKALGNPFNLLHSDEFEEAISVKHTSKVLLGHNRYATTGDKTVANAHPFALDNVIGMHNGTLDRHSHSDLLDYKKFGTDSEAIFNSFDKEDVPSTLKVMSGAWALVWYDKRDGTLNFLRNDKRPLHYCYSADRCTIIWASELEMLKYVLKSTFKQTEKDKDGNEAFFTVSKDMHYKWEVPKGINDKFGSPLQSKQEGKTWVWQNNKSFTKGSTTNNGTTPTYYSHGGYNVQNKQPEASVVVPFANRSSTKKFRQPYKDLYGRTLKKKDFEGMVQEGCSFCDANYQKWGEFIKVMGGYCGNGTPYICESCFNAEDTYEFTNYIL